MTSADHGLDAVVPFGDRAVLVHCGRVEQVWTLDAALRERPDLTSESVPGWGSVLVPVPDGVDPRDLLVPLQSLLDEVADVERPLEAREVFEIPVVYDGPDLDDVAAYAGLTVEEVVQLHASGDYRVAFVGFSPGFPYLIGLDPRLDVPRRAVPRPSVPVGSVAIGGGQAGVYSTTAPGGWHVLGSTTTSLVDPTRTDPARLHAGDRVRFVPVESRLAPSPWPERDAALAHGRGTVAAHVRGGSALVEGAARLGLGRSGVPSAGPSDPWAAAVVRRLVGAPRDAPVLEVGPVGLTLEVTTAITVAVADGDGLLVVDGRALTPGAASIVPGGAVLHVAPDRRRTATLAVRGLQAPPAFGASHDVLSGLGPPPLGPGDAIVIDQDLASSSTPSAIAGVQRIVVPSCAAASTHVRVVRGPHAVPDDATLRELLARPWTASTTSNRVGTRLEGAPLPEPAVGSLASLGMVQGAVQVPSGGLPVVLGPDHGTTGGYPVVAVVIAADLARVATALPGTRVRFALVGLDEARAASQEQAAALRTSVADLGLL